MSVILETRSLTIGYKSGFRQHPKIIASAIEQTLYGGELVCLIGPNGAGKSTLLRTLAGMQKPLEGEVLLMGKPVPSLNPRELAQHLSIVLTGSIQVGLMRGYQLVALGRHPHTDWSGRHSHHDEAVIQWALEAVGGQDLARRFVNELSDGERQKMMIARALAQEPDLMILDEPTAFLDLPRRVEIMHLLRRLARDTGHTILLSTHDLDLALRSADRIWLLPSDGKMVAGAPEDLVLSGAFEQAFQSEGIHFDIQTGAFKIHTLMLATVQIEGEGLRRVWTERALERAGYTVGISDTCISINLNPPYWSLNGQNFFNLDELLKFLSLSVES
jgi:iron complex transport system ATP-binding protein